MAESGPVEMGTVVGFLRTDFAHTHFNHGWLSGLGDQPSRFEPRSRDQRDILFYWLFLLRFLAAREIGFHSRWTTNIGCFKPVFLRVPYVSLTELGLVPFWFWGRSIAATLLSVYRYLRWLWKDAVSVKSMGSTSGGLTAGCYFQKFGFRHRNVTGRSGFKLEARTLEFHRWDGRIFRIVDFHFFLQRCLSVHAVQPPVYEQRRHRH